MAQRKSIPIKIQNLLWGNAAGRCQFKGCNRLVGEHGLTYTIDNFAEVAHIVGSSEDGPRGNSESESLQTAYSNLMLLCEDCHKLIDRDPANYTIELLRGWKRDHESRIEIQTSYADEVYKSTILMCCIKIGEHIPSINIEAARFAMRPKYPSDKKGILIENREFDKNSEAIVWQKCADYIERKVELAFDMGIDDVKIKHLSVFAMGPIPLIMFLGKCIGDKIPADLFQAHRDIEDTNKTWSWKESTIEEDSTYAVSEIYFNPNSTKVAISLAISDTIGEDKRRTFIDDSFSVYQITVQDLSSRFLKTKKQLEFFSYEYRKLLNQIQARHGRNCSIFLLPAIPNPIAIECGRVLLPTKDPKIFACDYSPQLGFRQVLQIN